LSTPSKAHRTRCFVFFLIAVTLQSCTLFKIQKAPSLYSEQELTGILNSLKRQGDLVNTFYAHGRISFQGRGSESEASALVVGERNPFRFRMEVTHLWGRPLFYILINENRLQFLSFPDKKYYVSELDTVNHWEWLPMQIDKNQLWALGRGFPLINDYTRSVSDIPNQILLSNEERATTQRIDLEPSKDTPQRIDSTENGLNLIFSEFGEEDGIQYARNIQFNDPNSGSTLNFHTKQAVFNKSIDKNIFRLSIPPGFSPVGNKPDLDRQ
jgi:hypothetical protein